MPGLALTELSLSHFRSHLAVRLDLDGRPVAIFGPNGAGKTNILEAISLLSPGRGLRRAATGEVARNPEALGWKVSCVLQSLHQVHEVETWAEGTGARLVRIDGKPAAQLALGRIARMLWLVPSMDRLWVEGAEGRRRFLDRMCLSFEPGHGDLSLRYDKAMRERNRLLRDQVRDAAWYDALEAQMATAAAAIEVNRSNTVARIAAVQQDARSGFPKAHLTVCGPEGGAPILGEAALVAGFAEGRGRDLLAGRTLIGPHRTDLAVIYAAKGVAAKFCSTGEQKALLISLILANARALTQDFGAPPILLLDEVAAHLDAARRAALYDEIVALGAQAFMTGTGSELFATIADRAQCFEVTDRGGVSRIDEGRGK